MATGRVPTTANSPLTAKGDLFTYSTAPARLAVGANGETLVADSSTSTGLRYIPATIMTNPVINSCFDIWQRGTSVASVAGVNYTADRHTFFRGAYVLGATISRQATNDTTNLPNVQYCARVARDSGNTSTQSMNFGSSMETANAVPFAGKTITFSFYARAGANFSSASNALSVPLYSGTGTDQNITGAYTGFATVGTVSATLTTTWQRFSVTATVAATATELAYQASYTPVGTAGANDYFEITGFQIDIGSVALPVRRNGATIQGELLACSRYFQVAQYGIGKALNGTQAIVQVLWGNMRVAPSYSIPSLNSILLEVGVAYRTPTSSTQNSISAAGVTNGFTEILFSGSTFTTNNLVSIGGNSVTFSAEL
jgi:hypothetical protein